MKHLLSTISLATLLAISSSASFAKGHKHHKNSSPFQDMARVTHVEPLYKTVRVSTPQHECWNNANDHYREHQPRSYTSTIAGGIIGGVIGNQFGGGNGKTVMTVAGTLLGGSLGNDYNNYSQRNTRYNNHENCRISQRYSKEKRQYGYQVSYRYHGKTYSTYMDRYPGKHIPVDVTVRPRHQYY
jgi:uncharacterized protein YcfJ